jgi:hypothetical protein
VFQVSEEELETRGISGGAGRCFEIIPPKKIPELVDVGRSQVTQESYE